MGRRVNIFLEESVNGGFQIHLMTPYFAIYNLPSLTYKSPLSRTCFRREPMEPRIDGRCEGMLIWKLEGNIHWFCQQNIHFVGL